MTRIFVETADTDALKAFLADRTDAAMATVDGMVLQRDGAWVVDVTGDGEDLRRSLLKAGFGVAGWEEIEREVDETWL